MKQLGLSFLLATVLYSCKQHAALPDVSGIRVDLQVQRFEKDFFSVDSNAVAGALPVLQQKYPDFLPIFIGNVLGLGPLRADNPLALAGTRRFLHLTGPLYDSVEQAYPSLDFLERDFREAFRFVKYYFPDYRTPSRIITLVGPPDGLAQMGSDYSTNFLGQDFLGISLQFYLGAGCSVYNNDYFIANVAPLYRSRRFAKPYILPDAMKLIVDDLFPDRSNGKPLVEQMIEKGKQWYMLDKFLPRTADSLKTGYTQRQLDWCRKNEGLIWNYIITNENLYSVEPATIQTYIGEAPFTQGMPEASPGNIGAWVGWQIVQKFVEKNPGLSPAEVMKTDARRILEESKYKPK